MERERERYQDLRERRPGASSAPALAQEAGTEYGLLETEPDLHPCSPSQALPLLGRPVNGTPGLKHQLADGQHRRLCRGEEGGPLGPAAGGTSVNRPGSSHRSTPAEPARARHLDQSPGWQRERLQTSAESRLRGPRGECPRRSGGASAAGKRRRVLHRTEGTLTWLC